MSAPASNHTDSHGNAQHAHFVPPKALYFGVFGGLLVLTVITVAIARVDLGPLNTIVAMLVATMKASLVSLFFMQLFWDQKLNGIVFVFGLVFLALFFIFTIGDIVSRGYLDSRLDNTVMEEEVLQEMKLKAEAAGALPAAPSMGLPADFVPPDEKAR